MPGNICRLAISIPQQLMTHGLMRPTLRGVTFWAKQDKVKKKAILKYYKTR